MQGVLIPINNCFLLVLVLWVSGVQALCWVFWGCIPWAAVLKVERQDVGSKPFTLQNEAASCMAMCWAYGLCWVFPTHFDVDIFLFIQCVWVTQLVSKFLSNGIAPCIAVYLVSPLEEKSLWSSYSLSLKTISLIF